MRHNNKNITIGSLEEKKLRKNLSKLPNVEESEKCRLLIDKHDKFVDKNKHNYIKVENDPFNTIFEVRKGKNINEVVKNYKK